MNKSLQYLQRNEIDSVKWNRCIDQAVNGMIYGYSWWLDEMAVKWEGLILNDYEAVMPLTQKRKYGIRYLYQPPFTQQLGIFSQEPVSPALTKLFLNEADKHFSFAEIFLNYGNPSPSLISRTNLILPLSSPYALINKNYKKDLIKNLKKAAHYRFVYKKDYNLDKALELFRQAYGVRLPHLKEEDYNRFRRACVNALEHKAVLLRALYDEQNRLLATALFLQSHGRLYLIQSTTLSGGRRIKANHYLLDSMIREFSERPLILDFEGSDIAGIAHFYKNFGSAVQPYFFYKKNTLLWPLNLLKEH